MLIFTVSQVEVGGLEQALDINEQTASQAAIDNSAGSGLEHLAMTAAVEQQHILEVIISGMSAL